MHQHVFFLFNFYVIKWGEEKVEELGWKIRRVKLGKNASIRNTKVVGRKVCF